MIFPAPGIALAAPAAPATGAALGRLAIPRLGLNVVFRQGIKPGVLDRGPGHYPASALPGEPGTIGIAGHRVTHTHPFRELNTMRKNDRIVITWHGHRFVYAVYRMRIVPQRQTWPLRATRFQQLVLTACHPPRTDWFRLVVFARRV